ncbi:hypothetical protein ES703_115832 [subsurface metagenome]
MDHTNWSGSKGGGVGGAFSGEFYVNTIGNVTRFQVVYGGVGVIPPNVDYAAAPPDVKALVRPVPAAAFDNFPLLVTP